jgi:hypothetical protein
MMSIPLSELNNQSWLLTYDFRLLWKLIILPVPLTFYSSPTRGEEGRREGKFFILHSDTGKWHGRLLREAEKP